MYLSHLISNRKTYALFLALPIFQFFLSEDDATTGFNSFDNILCKKNSIKGRSFMNDIEFYLVFLSEKNKITFFSPANGANERSEICVVSRGGNFFN